MQKHYNYLDIDLDNKNNYRRLNAMQGDIKSRYILVNLYSNNLAYDLTGCTVKFYGLKRDKTIFFNNAVIKNEKVGEFEIELTNQALAVEGELKIQILILGTSGEKLTSSAFFIDVGESIINENAIESTNEFNALTESLTKVNEWDSYFEETSGKIEEKYTERLNSVDSQIKDKANKSDLDNVNTQLNTIEVEKADIKAELMDTLMCNTNFFKLTNNSSYPILQGGCLSDDGLNYYCCLINSDVENEKSIIQKYSVGDISDFSTWKYVISSNELNLSHSNDMQYFNGKIYVCNTDTSPTEIIVINPNSLDIENTINIKYGATAITFNKKLNQFITRRKSERGTFDFYDVSFNYLKSSEVSGVTYDTVQGIDSDDSYIYEPCSEPSFGNSVVVYDLKGNFIKRIGSNIMSEVEHMTNLNGYYILGFYKSEGNFLSIVTIGTDKRLTGGRYKINQGRNTVLTNSTRIWNGDINLNFSKRYYSHLSFVLSVDGVEVETKILDITDYSGSHIINTFRLVGTGQIIFYRSLLILTDDNKLTITPFAFHLINTDGTRVIKLYSSEPSAFSEETSISISNICGQVLCGQRVDE